MAHSWRHLTSLQRLRRWCSEAGILLLLTLALALLKRETLADPFTWDALGYEAPSVFRTVDGSFLHPGHVYAGHPPAYTLLLAIAWKIHPGLPGLHLATLALAALSLVYTYKLGAWLSGARAGALASILLCSNQLFWAQIGTLNLTTPTLAFNVVAAYWYLRRRPLPYLVFGTLGILSHLSGWFCVVGCALHHVSTSVAQGGWRRLLRGAWVGAPVLALVAWLLHHGLDWSWWAPHGGHPAWAVRGSLVPLRTFVFDATASKITDANWILSFGIVCAVLSETVRWRWLASSAAFGGLVIVQIAILVACDLQGDHGTHPLLEPITWWAAAFAALGCAPVARAAPSDARISTCWLFATIATAMMSMLFRGFDLPRYATPLAPYFFVAGSAAFWRLAERTRHGAWSALLPATFVVGLSLARFHTGRIAPGYDVETNMDYRSFLQTDLAAARYLQANAGDATIGASFPLDVGLRDARYGYVSRGLRAHGGADPGDEFLVVSGDAVSFRLPPSAQFHQAALFVRGAAWTAVYARN